MLSVTREFTETGRSTSAVPDGSKIFSIRADKLVPNRAQPRRCFDENAIGSLADSISRYGLLQPLSVRRLPTTAEGVKYEIIAGERRYRAAMQAGMDQLPCIIINVDDRTSAELALIENIQREGLNMFEQAGAIAALIDLYGMTQEQIAAHLSASQSYVANKLRLLRLSPEERETVLSAHLSERHARALLRISDRELRASILDHIIENRLSVSRTEDYIDRRLGLVSRRSGTAENNGTAILLKSTSSGSRTISKCTSTADSTDDTASSNTSADDVSADCDDISVTAISVNRNDEADRTASEAESGGRGRSRHRKLVLHDLRLLYNTIDRALDLVRQSGAAVSSERSVSPGSGSVEIRIMITPPGAPSAAAAGTCEKH